MLQTSRARTLLGRPRTAAGCAALSLAVAAGMAGAVAAAAVPLDCATLRCAAVAHHLAAPVPATPRVANPPPAVPVYRPAATPGGMPTGPAPRP